mmetsp:Transcript_22451/g.47277  ORF Transcript_22451/g.47277 Transcript_22451/m.47277 type:complete len:354 (-) Transcript_22451:311-1372(-)
MRRIVQMSQVILILILTLTLILILTTSIPPLRRLSQLLQRHGRDPHHLLPLHPRPLANLPEFPSPPPVLRIDQPKPPSNHFRFPLGQRLGEESIQGFVEKVVMGVRQGIVDFFRIHEQVAEGRIGIRIHRRALRSNSLPPDAHPGRRRIARLHAVFDADERIVPAGPTTQRSMRGQFVGILSRGPGDLEQGRFSPEAEAQFGRGGVGAAEDRGEGGGEADGAGGGGEEAEEGGADGRFGVLFEGGGFGGFVWLVIGSEVIVVGGHGAEEGDHSFLDQVVVGNDVGGGGGMGRRRISRVEELENVSGQFVHETQSVPGGELPLFLSPSTDGLRLRLRLVIIAAAAVLAALAGLQ